MYIHQPFRCTVGNGTTPRVGNRLFWREGCFQMLPNSQAKVSNLVETKQIHIYSKDISEDKNTPTNLSIAIHLSTCLDLRFILNIKGTLYLEPSHFIIVALPTFAFKSVVSKTLSAFRSQCMTAFGSMAWRYAIPFATLRSIRQHSVQGMLSLCLSSCRNLLGMRKTITNTTLK